MKINFLTTNNNILVIVENSYPNISQAMKNGAIRTLKSYKESCEIIEVSASLELPVILSLILERCRYRGIVVLGCIKSDTDEDDWYTPEICARSIIDIAIKHSTPLGYGIIETEYETQANAEKYAYNAVRTCLQTIDIQKRLSKQITDDKLKERKFITN